MVKPIPTQGPEGPSHFKNLKLDFESPDFRVSNPVTALLVVHLSV
jgi:hypothetical protein